jgi:threonine dehydratase
LARMKEHNIQFEYINNKPDLFEFLIWKTITTY